MISDAERREVARRLREANVRREFYSPWCRMVESILDGRDCVEDDGTCDENACCERFMNRMADLIEPEKDRTCRMVHDNRYSEMYMGDMLRCISCGAALPEQFVGPYNYCPSCGAKVVGE